jgi:pimeloyl-ACP methyl ester carboxylesterase
MSYREEELSCAPNSLDLIRLFSGEREIHVYYGRAISENAKRADREHRPAVVCCPGFIQNRHTFSTPGRCFLSFLRRQGFDVYAVELHGHSRKDWSREQNQTFDAYVRIDMPLVLNQVFAHHADVLFVGHSMGGWIGTALDNHWTHRLKAMATIATPLYPGLHCMPGRDLAERGVIQFARMIGQYRGFIQGDFFARAFRLAKPLFESDHAPFPFQIWSPRSVDKEDLAFFLRNSFSPDSYAAFLTLMEMNRTKGEKAGDLHYNAALSRLRTPLLVVGGNADSLGPPPLVEALFDRAGSKTKEIRIVGGEDGNRPFGHMDLMIGRDAPSAVWNPLVSFFRQHIMARS